MHEMSIAQSVLAVAEEEAARHGGGRLRSVQCTVGVLQQIVPDLLTEAIHCLVEGTDQAGIEVDIRPAPVTLRCSACGRDGESTIWRVDCPACGSLDVTIDGGDEILLTGITTEKSDAG